MQNKAFVKLSDSLLWNTLFDPHHVANDLCIAISLNTPSDIHAEVRKCIAIS